MGLDSSAPLAELSMTTPVSHPLVERAGPVRLSLMHDDGYFGERVAASYDRPAGEEFDPTLISATVDFLVEHARPGRALELGIGTGRIALPLAERGVPVHG